MKDFFSTFPSIVNATGRSSWFVLHTTEKNTSIELFPTLKHMISRWLGGHMNILMRFLSHFKIELFTSVVINASSEKTLLGKHLFNFSQTLWLLSDSLLNQDSREHLQRSINALILHHETIRGASYPCLWEWHHHLWNQFLLPSSHLILWS